MTNSDHKVIPIDPTQRFALDENGLIALEASMHEEDGKTILSFSVDLSGAGGAENNYIKDNISELLGLSIDGGKAKKFQRDGNRLTFETIVRNTKQSKEFDLLVNHKPVFQFTLNDGMLAPDADNLDRQLTVSEVRMLSFYLTDYQREHVPYDRDYAGEIEADHLPVTDLHTHLSSQLSGAELLELAIKHDLAFPIELLDEMDIDYSGLELVDIKPYKFDPAINKGIALECEQTHPLDNDETYKNATQQQRDDYDSRKRALKGVKLEAFSEDPDKRDEYRDLQQLLSIPFDEAHGPDDFDKYLYRFRNPLEKNPVMARDKIMAVAKKYRDQGVQYAELSTGAMLDPAWLKEAIPAIEEAEEKYGVKMRLLVGIPRTDPPEKVANKIEKIKFLAQSPYIAGVDFLGFEDNATGDFSWAIYNLARWARRMNNNVTEVDEYAHFKDDFVIRVHAGENNENLQNVHEVVDIAKKFNVSVRIGHGIDAGNHPELLKKAKDAGVSFEFLPDSWIALSNAQYFHDLPLKKLVDAGVRWFAGTDGAGAYQTDNHQLAKSLMASGITLNDLFRMQGREQDHIDHRGKIFRDKQDYYNETFGNIETFVERYEGHARQIDDTKLHPGKAEKKNGLPKRYDDKKPILIAGASGTSWEMIADEHKQEIRTAMRMAVEMLDPREVYFATGRVKPRGIEKELDDAIEAHDTKNWKASPPFDMLATVAPEEGKVKIANGVTWVNSIKGKAMNVSEPVMQFIEDHDGIAILGGGRVLTGEFIRDAKRIGVNYAVLQGPHGTADREARRTDPKHVIAASDERSLAENIVMHIYQQMGPDVFLDSVSKDNEKTMAAAIKETYQRVHTQVKKEAHENNTERSDYYFLEEAYDQLDKDRAMQHDGKVVGSKTPGNKVGKA